MTNCKECGAPLDGPLSFVARLMGVKRSEMAPDYCNKCEDMAMARTRVGTAPAKRVAKKAPSKEKKK